jgi:hypothetical protein
VTAYVGITEDAWLRVVTDLAHAYGWRDYHVDRSAKRVVRRSGVMTWATNVSRQGKGFPDLVLVRRRDWRLVFAELKRDKDSRVTPEQREWLDDLGALALGLENIVAPIRRETDLANLPRIDVAVWRPRDYDDVERTLRPAVR